MVYKWRDGTRVKVAAQVAGEEIERIREANGGNITAEILLDAARDESSPIHAAFEWDNRKAAHEYRKHQAHVMLCSITYTLDEKPDVGEVRAFVNVHDDGSVYTNMRRAMSQPDLRAQILGKAKSEALSWRQRYGQLQELAKIHAAIDATTGVASKVS